VSEERFRSLFESSANPITVMDRDGVVLMVNPTGARNLGRGREECIGQSVFQLMPDLDDSYHEIYRQVIDMGTRVTREDSVQLPDGRRWFWSVLEPVADSEGRRYAAQAISYDITPQKEADIALRESEAKFSALVEQAKVGIVIVQDEVIKYANPFYITLLDSTEEHVIGIPFLETVSLASRQEVLERYTRRMQGEELGPHYEVQLPRKDGGFVAVEATGGQVQYDGRPAAMAIVHDITDRKRIERELRESEVKYAMLVEGASDGIAIGQDGIIVYCNPAHANMLGYTVDELVGMSYLDTVAPESRELVLERYRQRIAGEDADWIPEYKLLCKDGTIRHVLISSHATEHKGKQAFMAIFHDITKSRQAEEALRQSEERRRSLLENSPDLVFEVDREGRFLFMNRPLPGFPIEEVVGRTCYDFVPPEYHDAHQEAIAHVFETGQIQSC
jgi:PAS domain S-box-containing protein